MLHHYLLLSLKVLLRRKFFTFISIFGISFTLVVLMIVSAILDATLGPGKPVLRQDRMLAVRTASMTGPGARSNSHAGYKLFDRYARDLPGVERLTIFTTATATASFNNGQRIEVAAKRTDAAFWHVFDFDFVEGRAYSEPEVDSGQPLAVINRATRTRLFGEASAVGRTIDLSRQSFRIVGVVEDVSIFREDVYADAWIPTTTLPSSAYKTQLIGGQFVGLVLAKDAESLQDIRDEFNSRIARAELDDPEIYTTLVAPFETRFEFFAREIVGDQTSTDSQAWKLVILLTTLTLLFMALPAVNLVNINISRILERSSEIGVRKAFGAPARSLVMQFIVENVVLTLTGAAAAFAISAALLRAINQSGAIPYAQLALNVRVFIYGVGLAFVFGLVSGVYPAVRMARLHAVAALRGGGR